MKDANFPIFWYLPHAVVISIKFKIDKLSAWRVSLDSQHQKEAGAHLETNR